MTFAVTAYKTFPLVSAGCTRRFVQRVEFDVTAANTDTDADIGDVAAGAFWTDAEADVTHGAKATALKAHLTALYAIASEIKWAVPVLDADYSKQIATPVLANEFNVARNATSKIPEFTFVSGSAPTAFTVIIDADILEASNPVSPTSSGTI